VKIVPKGFADGMIGFVYAARFGNCVVAAYTGIRKSILLLRYPIVRGRRIGAFATTMATASSTVDQMSTLVKLWESVTEMTHRIMEAIMANEPRAKRDDSASFFASEMRSLGRVQSVMNMTAASVVTDRVQNTMLAAFEAAPQTGSSCEMISSNG